MTSLRRTVDEKEGSQHGVLDVQVFHVDFGSSEWVSVGDVKPLVAKFSSLPGQVVKCRLANLKPEGFEGESFPLPVFNDCLTEKKSNNHIWLIIAKEGNKLTNQN